MGAVSSTQQLRTPENSLNPLLAAQAHTVIQPAGSAGSIRQQLQQPGHLIKPQRELASAGLWVLALAGNVLAGLGSSEVVEPAVETARWHLTVLTFLTQACKLRKQSPVAVKDEADSPVQHQNRPGRKGSSKYRGLSWHKGVGKWAVQLRISGQNQQLGYYDDEDEAARVSDHHVIMTRPLDAPTNFRRPANGQGYDIMPIVTPKRRKAGQSPLNQSMHLPSTRPFASLGAKDGVTAYRGVTFEKTRKLWRSQAYVNGKTQYLGMFQTAEEGARAHDTALIDHNILNHRGFNFPKEAATYLATKRSAHGPSAESSRLEAQQSGHSNRNAAVTSPRRKARQAPVPDSLEPEDGGFDVPLRARELDVRQQGRTPSWSPEPRQASGSPTPHLNALAALCAEAVTVDGTSAPGSTVHAGSAATAVRPGSPGRHAAADTRPALPPQAAPGAKLGAGGLASASLAGQIGLLPQPKPRSRQRKPDKRKRVEPKELLAGPSLTRGRGRPRGSGSGRRRGRGRSGVPQDMSLLEQGRQLRSASHPGGTYQGVQWDPLLGCWTATVLDGTEALRIGSYQQEESAARAYDEAVRSLRLDVETNFPPRRPPPSSLHHHAAVREPMPPRPVSEAGPVSNPLAVAGAAALAKFGRVFEERTRDAGAVEDPSDSNWDGSPRARRKARSRRARGPSRPGNSMLPGGVWRGRGRGSNGRQVKRGVSGRDHGAGPGLGASHAERKRRSRYRGVSYEEATSTWVAALRHHGQSVFIGRFHTELAASEAYDHFGLEKLGERFPMNHPSQSEPSGFSTATSDSVGGASSDIDDDDNDDDLLPPVPQWGRRVRLATHQSMSRDTRKLPAGASLVNGPLKPRQLPAAANVAPATANRSVPAAVKPGIQKAATAGLHPRPQAAPTAPLPASAALAAGPNLQDLGAPMAGGMRAMQLQLQQRKAVPAAAVQGPAMKARLQLQPHTVAISQAAAMKAQHQLQPAQPRVSQAEAQPLGPLRLVDSGGCLHLATDDPNTKVAIRAALQQPRNAGVSVPRPAKPPPGHLMTLPESSRKALDAAFKQSSKSMTASELLSIIGLPNVAMKPPGSGTAGPPLPSNPPAITPTWPPPFSRAAAGNSMAGGKADHQAAPAASLQGIKAAGTPIGNVPYVPDATRSVYTALLQQHTQALATALARTQGGRKALSSLTKGLGLGPLVQGQQQQGGIPEGFLGPHIPQSLRRPGSQATAADASQPSSSRPPPAPLSGMQLPLPAAGSGFAKFSAAGGSPPQALPATVDRTPAVSAALSELQQRFPSLAKLGDLFARTRSPGGQTPQGNRGGPASGTAPSVGNIPGAASMSAWRVSSREGQAGPKDIGAKSLPAPTAREAPPGTQEAGRDAQQAEAGTPDIGCFRASQMGGTSVKVPSAVEVNDAYSDKPQPQPPGAAPAAPSLPPAASLPAAGAPLQALPSARSNVSQGIMIAPGGRSRVVSSSSFKPSAGWGKPSPSRVESGRPERFQIPHRTSMSPGDGNAGEIPGRGSTLLRELPASKAPTGQDEAAPEAAKHKLHQLSRFGAINSAAAVPQSPWNAATQSQQSGSQVVPSASVPASLKLGSSSSSGQLRGNAPALGTSRSAPASARMAAGHHRPSAAAPDGGAPGTGPTQSPVAPAHVNEAPDAAQQQPPGSEHGLAASTTVKAVGESCGSPGGPAIDAAAGSVEAAPRQQKRSVELPADLVHVNPVDGQPQTPSAGAVSGREASTNNTIQGSKAMPEGDKSLAETENTAQDQGALPPS